MKATLAAIVITVTTLISACSKNNHCKDKACEKTVLLNNELYNDTKTDNYIITDASVSGDCLEIKFGASGCDSKSWIVELVDADQITATLTPYRSLKLALTNNEMCAASFAKTVSFDLLPLRIKGSNELILSLSGLNKTIIYKY